MWYWFGRKVTFFLDSRSSFQFTNFCNTYDHGKWFLVGRIKIGRIGFHFYSKLSHGYRGWRIK